MPDADIRNSLQPRSAVKLFAVPARSGNTLKDKHFFRASLYN
jgi:hypothetical protein